MVGGQGELEIAAVLREQPAQVERAVADVELRIVEILDPEINVRYGSWYLRNLLDRYDDDLPTALAAYHAGQGNVDAWRRRGVGIQFPETRSYVRKVLHAEEVYADAYADELSGA